MSLKHYLDDFLDSFPKERHIEMDPVQFVHRYSDSADREVVGFIAAAFSYGNVKSVLRSVERVLARLGDNPARFIASFDPRRDSRVFRGFRHRWNTGKDVAVLLWILRRLIEEHGSLQAAIAGGIDPRNGSVATAPARTVFFRGARPRARAVLFRRRAAPPSGRPLFLSEGFRRERLQAPQPVHAMDGATRRRG